MKTCIVYGNCHIWPLRQYLTSSSVFNREYTMIHVPVVHQCDPRVGLPIEALQRCDLFIYQVVKQSFGPLLSTDYLLSLLPASCIRISFGNAYFLAYYPQFDRDETFPYGDKNVIRMIRDGWSRDQIMAAITSDEFYSREQVLSVLDSSLAELRRRDKGLDIPITDFIERFYQPFPLFYTFNHPTSYLVRYLAMRMLHLLGMPAVEIGAVVWEQHLSDHTHPIYPSVAKHLQLRFYHPANRYMIGNAPHTFDQYIDAYIRHLVSR